ncbi:type II toxin-antitoxin system VapB family antitoxin, partial [Fulvivirga sp.]
MRTNIDINEDLLNEYKKLVGAKTKKEAIHHALHDA